MTAGSGWTTTWQPGWEYSGTAGVHATTDWSRAGAPTDQGGYHDVNPMLQTAANLVMANAHFGTGGIDEIEISASKLSFPGFGIATGVFLRAYQVASQFIAPAPSSGASPPLLDTLINGIDWHIYPDTYPPTYGPAIYEATNPVSATWGDISVSVLAGTFSSSDGASGITGLSTSLRVQRLTAMPASGDGPTTTAAVLASIPWSSSAGSTTSVPSGGTDLQLVVTFIPEFLISGMDSAIAPDWGASLGVYSWDTAASIGSPAPYTATTSRWKYWKPGAIVPSSSGPGLRLTQRNDGLGSTKHPRLAVGNPPSSVQRPSAPRLGERNRYL